MLIAALPLLSGCNAVLLSPSGDVALQQRNLIIISTVLMLLIIVPVILLTFLFAWRYRANNKAALRSRMEPLHRAGAADLGGACSSSSRWAR